MPATIAAVAIARTGPSGRPEWLVAQRLPAATFGGFWEWPGGKVEPGETSVEAAARELFEEVGVRVAALDLRPVGTPLHAGPIVLELFWTMAPRDAAPRAIGCAQVRWVQASELVGLTFPPANAPLTERIVALDRLITS
ncbi:MAG: NUDIX domain-containing protein [Planctomycetota bacterium]|nr:MAG: NUDIX domain-containing protein [Planctomycetota bacterium]